MQNEKPGHEHCYHLHSGPILMVIPDSHVRVKCCKCENTKTVHREHFKPDRHTTGRW